MTSPDPVRRAAPRPTITQPSVLILKEKHGEGYFLVRDDEELHKYALMILKGRAKDRWYFQPKDPADKLDFTEEDIAKMPTSLQEDAKKKLVAWRRKNSEFLREKRIWDQIQKAIQENDGNLAYQVLLSRRDYEYEEFRISNFAKSYG